LGFKHVNFGHSVVIKAFKDLVLVAERREILGSLGGFAGFGGFDASFFDVLFVVFTLDFLEEMFLSLLEEFVVINVIDILSSSFVEIVHVELTNKGSKIVMFEIGRKDFLAEFRRLFDNESVAFRVPVNDFGEFSLFENVVGFANKRGDGVLGVGLGFSFVFAGELRKHSEKKREV
jgi:hypothetical protein